MITESAFWHVLPAHHRRALATEEVGALLAQHHEARAAPRRRVRAVGVPLRPRARLQVEHPQVVQSSVCRVDATENPCVPGVTGEG